MSLGPYDDYTKYVDFTITDNSDLVAVGSSFNIKCGDVSGNYSITDCSNSMITITDTPDPFKITWAGPLLPSGEQYIWLSKEEQELIAQYRKDGKSVKITQETKITVEEPKQGRKFKEII